MQRSIRTGKIRNSAADADDNVPLGLPRPAKEVCQLEHLLLKRVLTGRSEMSHARSIGSIGPCCPDAEASGHLAERAGDISRCALLQRSETMRDTILKGRSRI